MRDGRDDEVAHRLRTAPLEPLGRFPTASNATLLVRLRDRDPRSIGELAARLGRTPTVTDLPPDDLAVYKPRRGEAPLWDFPEGTLHKREVAAYLVSEALGWDLVPVTVLRDDAPFGPGSVQRYVPHDPDDHYFSLVEQDDAEVARALARMVVFDLLIDNADRKGGHVLREAGGTARIRLVDHGVSFHTEPKLRTVAWHLADAPVPAHLRDRVAAVAHDGWDALVTALAPLLSPEEIASLRHRAVRIAGLTRFPSPQGPRPYPWPLL